MARFWLIGLEKSPFLCYDYLGNFTFTLGAAVLNHAVFCLITVLLSLTGCAGAESHIQGRACSASAAPISTPEPIAETVVADPMPVTVSKTPKLKKTMTLEVSGYTSEVAQTDNRPCEAADQTDICRRKAAGELICASNVFPLGANIHVDGLGTCVVADRMNSRYKAHVDWYFADKRLARKIGRKNRTVTIVTR